MRSAQLLGMLALLGWSLASSASDYVAMSGDELYMRFCSSCHGATARGDGPVAKSFKAEVPDLTLIARRAGGVFPRERIEKIIDGRFSIAAHGSRTMPVWGEDFSRVELGNPDAERGTRLMIQRLTDYVRQLQQADTEHSSEERR